MDLSPQALSVYFIVAVILAAIVLAFIVDLLKGNVDQLREVAIDLKARKEAAETHIRSLELILTHQQQPMTAMATAGIAPPVMERALLPEGVRDGRPEVAVITQKHPAPAPAAAAAPAPAPAPTPIEKPARRMSPAVAAVAESVAQRMANNTFRPATPAPEPVVVVAEAAPKAAAPAPAPTPVANPSSSKLPGEKTTIRIPIVEPVPPSLEASKKNWNQILTAHKGGNAAPASAPSAAAAHSPASPNGNVIEFRELRINEPAQLPAGLFDYSVLQKQAAEGKTFNGLIVSIGMSPVNREHVGIVHGFLGSLMDATDFACWSDSDQFLLVSSDISGDAAQRRLARITEKLWDFQLRSMGSLNIQFAWGGKEGRGSAERLNDVVASAIEQMRETRDARRNRMPAGTATSNSSSSQSAQIAQAV
ncbi:hypothetical protein F183_A07850 [Bryobacterales bacterium F-183]|nr:hypothetical protein F183_A07850 [Bryobacterales bacterium F-183]